MRAISTLFLLLTISTFTKAQIASGLVYGQQNGISAASLNPALIANYKHAWELQFGGAHIFAQSNYGRINKTNTLHLARNAGNVFIPNNDSPGNSKPLAIYFNDNDNNKFFDFKSEAIGPGLLIKLNNGLGFGLSSKGRAYASGNKIPPVLNYNEIILGQLEEPLTVEPTSGTAVAWGEVNAHFSIQKGNYSFGVTGRYMQAFGAAYYRTDIPFTFINIPGDTIVALSDGIYNYGFAVAENQNPVGSGFGVDIGYTYYDEPTKASFGAAILDIGYLNIDGSNYTLRHDSLDLVDGELYRELRELDDFHDQLKEDEIGLDSSSGFRIFSPTALSLHLSVPVNEQLSLQGTIVQRLNFLENHMARSNSLNVTGVYAKNNFSAFVPLTLYNYKHFRPGLAVQYYMLTLGSDDLFSLVGRSKRYNGTDLYLKVNFYPFWNKKKKKKSGKQKFKAKSVKCPSPD